MPSSPLPWLAIEYVPITALKLDPNNPRLHSPKQIGQIASSIRTFGFIVPAMVNADNKVIAGHGRILAARELKMTEVPIIRIEHLSEAQARAFMIADNRLTENSVWDDRLLAVNLKELSELDIEFDLEVTGFDMGEIDFRIESLDAPAPETESLEDVSPAPGPPVTRRGDLWLLGKSRIFCGDALAPASYQVLMQDERAAMIFTDPPYNVPIAGHVSGLGVVQHREFAMGVGEMDAAQFTAFLTNIFERLVEHSDAGSLHYVFMDWRHLRELLAAGENVYSEYKNLCVWAKTNAGMGSLYRSQHELVAVFKNGDAQHWNNVQLGRFGRNRSNLWTYAGMTSIQRATDEGDLLAMHPTVKPVQLVADAILDASARNDIILDPFLGSGSTLIAAERVGRRCYGLELDPVYVDVAIRRWQRATKQRARHAESGAAFDDVAAGASEDDKA